MSQAPTAVEYRFNYDVAPRRCPLCDAEFEPRAGSWPFIAGSATPVCGGSDCPIGEDVTGTSPCDTLFEFTPLQQQTLDAIARAATDGEPVSERLRRVALDESLPDADRAVLQLAAIDLQFCEAETTQIRTLGPRMVVQTCGEAAAELLLSGCGEILQRPAQAGGSARGPAQAEGPARADGPARAEGPAQAEGPTRAEGPAQAGSPMSADAESAAR